MRRWKKRKEIEAQRVKHPTPCQAIDALKEDEDQKGKWKKTKRKKQGAVPQPSYPGIYINMYLIFITIDIIIIKE